MEVGLRTVDYVLDGTQPPFPKRRRSPPIFGPCLLWPSGCRPWSSPHCARWGHSSPPPKRGQSPPPIFGPSLLWPNGWMHQDATWYGGRPQQRRLCVRLGPSLLPEKGRSPTQFSAHIYCRQTAAICMDQDATWYGGRPRVSLRNIVFDVYPATPGKKGTPTPPNFWPMSIVARWLDG